MKIRQRFLRLLLLLLFASAFAAPGLLAQDQNDHQLLIAGSGEADKYSGAGFVEIFDRTVSDVQETGLTYVDQERLWKILTPAGAKAMRGVTFDYDPLYGLVEIKAARIYRKDGTVEEIPKESIQDYAAPARGIYWNLKQVLVPAGRLEPGDGLFIKIFRKGFTYALLAGQDDDERFIPPMRGHYYDIVDFYSSHPLLEKTYTALLPAGKPVQYQVYNGEVQSSIYFKDGKTAYTWTKKDIEPFKSEPDQVAASDVATKLLVSTAPDWESKSLWFQGVNEDFGSFDVTPEVQAKVDELLEGVESDEERIWILTHWVADEIRYSGISMGHGEGYTLHTGESIFYDRCGVCKDKAGMLITMLRAAGYESYPAMTMAGSRIDPIPADQFNHCVTLVKLGDIPRLSPGFGDYKLLDPTWVPFMRELWSSAEQQQNYLPGVPEGAGLQITQLSAPENHYFRVTGRSKLDADGNLEGSFVLTAEGQSDAAVRWNMVRRRMKSVWHTYWDGVVHAFSPRAELLSVEYGDPYDLSDPIEVTVNYRIPRYAQVAGNQIRFTPCVALYPCSDTAGFLHTNLDLKDRKHSFRTRTSRLVELSETVEIPAGFSVSHAPSHDSHEGTAASFEGGYEHEDGTLRFNVRLELVKRIYEPGDYGDFCKAVKGIKHMMENDVVLTNGKDVVLGR